MIEDTILVIDADDETKEKIVSILEEEGYLVLTASGHDVITGMVENASPALIYLKPAANTGEELEVCKAIHRMEKYRNVPIILLAPPKVPLDPRYNIFYGVVDYLEMPLTSEGLVKKTREILGRESDDLVEAGEEYIALMEEESVLAVEEEIPIAEGPEVSDKRFAGISEVGQPNRAYTYRGTKEDLRGGPFKRRRRRKQHSFLIPVAVLLAGIAVVAAGFLSYRFFSFTPKVKMPVALIPPKVVQKQAPPVFPPPEKRETGQLKQKPVAEARPIEKKEVSEEAPAAVRETKAVGNLVYSVQLGAFRNESGAAALVNAYKGKGYEVFIQTGKTKGKGAFYRVLIGQFANRNEAKKLAAQVETKEKVKTTIFRGIVK